MILTCLTDIQDRNLDVDRALLEEMRAPTFFPWCNNNETDESTSCVHLMSIKRILELRTKPDSAALRSSETT